MTPLAADAAALARWQQALLTALWAPTHDTALQHLANEVAPADRLLWRGLAAYRSHAAGQAERSLRAAYSVVARLLGAEDFDALARWHWRTKPPARADLACWGEALATQIEELPDLVADQPWLADVARTEWALHRIATASDAVQDPSTFTLLASTDPAQLRLALAPGACSVPSAWPVVALIQGAASDRPPPGCAETALVWRCGWRPMLRPARPGEAVFLQALLQGQNLAAALAAAPDLDFSAWLAPAVHEGLLLQVETIVEIAEPHQGEPSCPSKTSS